LFGHSTLVQEMSSAAKSAERSLRLNAANGCSEPKVQFSARCPNDCNAQKADFAKPWVQIVIEVYFLRTLGLSIAG
ncbi:hypothetical protein, partial [Ruegeria sp. HKCCA5426]|uniref:hypothetical protein n=1 Tax=Ruegeria sp. HKCCA5426 TaxID=2682985 RepID=UPI001C2BBDA8